MHWMMTRMIGFFFERLKKKEDIFFFRWKIEIYFIEWTPSVIFSLAATSENITDGVHEMK